MFCTLGNSPCRQPLATALVVNFNIINQVDIFYDIKLPNMLL